MYLLWTISSLHILFSADEKVWTMFADCRNILEISDPVYTFTEVMDHIDLKKYFAKEGYRGTGRPRCDCVKMLKVILFAFMEGGYESLRQLEKLCK